MTNRRTFHRPSYLRNTNKLSIISNDHIIIVAFQFSGFFTFLNLRMFGGNNFRFSNINLIHFVGDTSPKTLKFAFLKLTVEGARNYLSRNFKHDMSRMCLSHDFLSCLQIIRILLTSFSVMPTFCLFWAKRTSQYEKCNASSVNKHAWQIGRYSLKSKHFKPFSMSHIWLAPTVVQLFLTYQEKENQINYKLQ